MDIERIKRDREKWLRALETTYERQGRYRMGNAESGFCCLGLGCHVLGVPYDPHNKSSSAFQARVGLISVGGYPKCMGKHSLILLNDNKKASFKEIAAILRANMSAYFRGDTL